MKRIGAMVALCAAVNWIGEGAVSGAVHRVNIQHPAADDGNPGTAERPFRTIQAAVNAAANGDTVLVLPGIYRESVIVDGKCGLSAEQPFRLLSAEPGQAIIRGSDVVTDWQLAGAGLFRAVWRNPVLQPRHYEAFRFAAFPDQVFVDGKLLAHVEFQEQLVPGAFWVDRPNELVYLKLDDGDSPAGRRVEISRRDGWVQARNVRFFQLKGFRMEHSTACIQTASCHVAGEDSILEDNECAFAGAGAGFGASGARLTVRNNSSHDNGQMGVSGHLVDSVFEKNHVFRNNTRPIPGWESGVGKFACCRRTVFRDNVFADTAFGPGLWLDIENYLNTIERNTFHNIEGNAIMIEISYANTIRNNIIVNANRRPRSYSRAGILVQLSSKTRIYNNLIRGTDGYGVHLRWHVRERAVGGDGFIPADPEEFKRAMGFAQSDWMDSAGQYPLDDNEIFNNLFVDNTMGAIRIDFHPKYVHRNMSDFNLFWDTATRHPMDGGHRLLEWQETTGLDLHSVYSKEMHDGPLFVNEAAGDYRPAAGSPAIGKGTNLTDVAEDFLGNPRPRDKAPDIGPFQSR